MRSQLKCEVMRPSALGAAETDVWHHIMGQSPYLRRAFFAPGFALACERSGRRAYVAVLHDGSEVQAFFPFQFKTLWHERVRLAERIGGNMSQGASLVASPGVSMESQRLLRLCGLSAMHVTQLMQGQEQFGLDAEWSQLGYLTDVRNGPEAYFAALLERDRLLVRDTERRERKAEKTYGPLHYTATDTITSAMLAELIRSKRVQYSRTQAPDPFINPANVRLIDVMNEMAAPDCRLVMHRLSAGERVLAQHLGVQYDDVISHWFPVYDPDARSVSPGRLLLWNMIRRAADDGVRIIDYGEGDQLYKQELSSGTLRYGRALWLSGGLRSFPAHTYQRLEWRLQARRRRLGSQAAAQG